MRQEAGLTYLGRVGGRRRHLRRAIIPSSRSYITGRTMQVSSAAESVPPTMTTAIGRCVSLPIAADSAAGHQAERREQRRSSAPRAGARAQPSTIGLVPRLCRRAGVVDRGERRARR